MTTAALLALVALALVDSTSFGTLVIPLLMLLQPRIRAGRIVLYLATIGTFYWLLGLALLGGMDVAAGWATSLESSRTVDWVQLVVGAAMLLGGFWPDTPWAKRRAAERMASGGRRQRWSDRVLGAEASPRVVVMTALAAGLVEAASMLPYLGAIGIITASSLHTTAQAGVLAGYVAVMTLPALLLLGLRLALGARVAAPLSRVGELVGRATSGAIWWVVGIAGFLLAADAVQRLGLFR